MPKHGTRGTPQFSAIYHGFVAGHVLVCLQYLGRPRPPWLLIAFGQTITSSLILDESPTALFLSK